MDNLRRLQGLVLIIIIFLVWFDLMCFSLILAGQIFKWSFFNESISGAFFTTFGLSLGALAALAVLHVVLTLSAISHSISLLVKDKEVSSNDIIQKGKSRFVTLIVASVVGIILIVGYQGVVERNAARHKVRIVETQLNDVAQSSLALKIAELIDKNESINRLYFLRDEMLLSLEGERGIILLIPKTGESGKVFYQITPWDYDTTDEKNISLSLTHLFIPDKNEKKEFNNLLNTHQPFTVVERHHIRVFSPVIKDRQLKFILLLDTSRNISSQHLMSRSKLGD